jgi:hypothetical protein
MPGKGGPLQQQRAGEGSRMPEPASPELEAEFQRLRDMAEQLKAALAVLKKQIDAASPPAGAGGRSNDRKSDIAGSTSDL